MRKSLLVSVILCVLCICVAGYLVWYVRETPQPEGLKISEGVDVPLVYRLDEADSFLVQQLTLRDAVWQSNTTKAIHDHEQKMNENEAMRQEMQRQKEAAKVEFMSLQLQQAKEQAELLAKMQEEARQAVLTQGGSTPIFSDTVYLSGQPPSQPVNGGGVEAPVGSGKTGDVVVDDGTVETQANYYGQMVAQLICTCTACYSSDVCPEVTAGGNLLLVDGVTVPANINVTFDINPSGVFHTQSSTKVTGRNAILFCNDHSIAGEGSTIYPKVTGDNSVG